MWDRGGNSIFICELYLSSQANSEDVIIIFFMLSILLYILIRSVVKRLEFTHSILLKIVDGGKVYEYFCKPPDV
jgi:hypothetical protein